MWAAALEVVPLGPDPVGFVEKHRSETAWIAVVDTPAETD